MGAFNKYRFTMSTRGTSRFIIMHHAFRENPLCCRAGWNIITKWWWSIITTSWSLTNASVVLLCTHTRFLLSALGNRLCISLTWGEWTGEVLGLCMCYLNGSYKWDGMNPGDNMCIGVLDQLTRLMWVILFSNWHVHRCRNRQHGSRRHSSHLIWRVNTQTIRRL